MSMLRPLLLGALALAGWHRLEAVPDFDLPNFTYTGGPVTPRHRSSGARAHRQWRKVRSAGRR